MDLDPRMPLARQHDLVATPSGDDLLVYDRTRHHIHHLNPFAAAVWLACDGHQPVATLAATLSIELGIAVAPEAVRLALTHLADANLLAAPLADDDRVGRSTRRLLLRKAAAAGLAVPAIASVTAPEAAAAVSCGLDWEDCTTQPCCDGTCFNGQCCPAEVCGGQCCTYGSCIDGFCCPAEHVCADGTCCLDGKCFDGTCCPSPYYCPDQCCGVGFCIDGACCPSSQLCGAGDVCCPAGTSCDGSECCTEAEMCNGVCCQEWKGRCKDGVCVTDSPPV